MRLYKLLREIKRIKIQGASSVTIAGVKAFRDFALELKERSKVKFMVRLTHALEKIIYIRITEPALVNGIYYIIKDLKKEDNVAKIKEKIEDRSNEYINLYKKSKEKAINYASKLVRSGMTILTHCHSSTVVEALIKARNKKNFSVIATETRPLYQGRKTATELSKAGINVTLIVDSAVNYIMDEVSIVMVGNDALLNDKFANKIGTSTIAICAKEHGVKFYTVGSLLKYCKDVEIEERNAKEVWKDAPANIKILNPAFDFTPYTKITSVVCEDGIINPFWVKVRVKELYPWII